MPALDRPEALWAYLKAHPERAAFAAFPLGQPEEGVAHRADLLRPIGSVMKVLLLYGLVLEVLAGRARWEDSVPLAEVEAFWLPGTDGGAHEAAKASLSVQGGALEANSRLTLREVAWAMIAHSDNAATDYLVWRLGQERLESLPASLGLSGRLEPPISVLGCFMNWLGPKPGPRPRGWTQRCLHLDRGLFRQEAAERAARAIQDPEELAWARGAWKPGLASRQVKELAWTLPQASASALAELMARVASDRLEPPGSAAMMRSFLNWPLEAAPQLKAQHAALGYKPGTIDGVLAGAWYQLPAQEDGPPASVAVLLLHDLPLADWRAVLASAAMQSAERGLLARPAQNPLA